MKLTSVSREGGAGHRWRALLRPSLCSRLLPAGERPFWAPWQRREPATSLNQALRGCHGTGSGRAFWDDCAVSQGEPNAGYLELVETLSLT